jgi:predicted DNA-binding protein YlxM (UPF0122 family)
MEKIVTQGLLYDFYGELLTEHQRKVYEDFVYHDLSLSEIAEEYQISRQGIHDLLRRCDRRLEAYEDKLQLVARFLRLREKIETLQRLAEDDKNDRSALTDSVNKICKEIFEEL